MRKIFAKRCCILLLIFFAFPHKTIASNYYWIGGTGNWSDLNHWATTSGGSTLYTQIPTALDDVFFDANSFSSPGQTVTFDALTTLAHNISWIGAINTPIMAGPFTNMMKIYGSLTLIPAMSMQFAGAVSFEATTPGNAITMSGHLFSDEVVFNGVGGEWVLMDDFTTLNGITFNNGILTTNSKTVNAFSFHSNTNTPRILNMGESVFNVEADVLCWWIGGTGITVNCGTSLINCSNSAAEFRGGGFTYYDLQFTATGAASSGRISNSNNFHNVVFAANGEIVNSNTFNSVIFNGDGIIEGDNVFNDLTFTTGHSYSIWSSSPTVGSTQTINGTFNANGSCGDLIDIHAKIAGAKATINHPPGAVNVSYVVLKDIHATGGAAFTATNSSNLGNNIGWTFNNTASQNLYWIGNSGNWDDGNHWSFTSGGTASGCSPTPSNNVIFDANSFSIPLQTVTINPIAAYCKNMDWSAATNYPILTGPSSNLLKIYGSLSLIQLMNMNFTGVVNFESTTAGQTILMAGKHFYDNVNFNGISGEWTLLDAFATSKILLLNAGTLNSNDQTVAALKFQSATGAPRTLNMSTSVFAISGNSVSWIINNAGITLNCGTSIINCSNVAADFNGGGQTYYDLNFTATGNTSSGSIIGNNIFHDVIFSAKGTIVNSCTFHNVVFYADGIIEGDNIFNDLTFTAGHTYSLWSFTSSITSVQTINGNFNANGSCGALIDIHSKVPGVQANIVHPAGTVEVSYVILKDINAVGAAGFTALNSSDLGNNSGWNFTTSGGKDLYWIGNSGNWDDGNHWSLTSGGAASGCSPTPVDNVFFDANSFLTTGQSVQLNVLTAYCKNMSWASVTNDPAFTGSSTSQLAIYGSLELATNMTMALSGTVSFEATTIGQTIKLSGKIFFADVIFNGIDGSWQLQDAFSTTNAIILNNGSLITNNQTVNAAQFKSTSLTQRMLQMGTSVFNITGTSMPWWIDNDNAAMMIIQGGTSVINVAADEFIAGSNQTYYDVIFTGTSAIPDIMVGSGVNHFHDVVLSADAFIYHSSVFNKVTFMADGEIGESNTYNELIFSSGHTYIAWKNTTQTINDHWSIHGSCTSYIVLQTDVAGSEAYISKATGDVTAYNIHLRDIHGIGGANFIAYNSVNLGGNTGWNFSTLPPLQSPDLIVGPAQVCPGSTGIIYHIPPVQGAISYSWTVPPGASITSGQGDTLIVVDFGTAISGDITVESYNGCNFGTFSSTFAVVLGNQPPPTVTISSSQGNTVCPAATVTFTAAASNTSTGTVSYEFLVNGVTVQNGASSIYTVTGLANNDEVICNIILSGSPCSPATTAVSNSILMIVNPAVLPVNVNAGNDITIATGQTIQLPATGNQGIYYWEPPAGLNATNILNPTASPALTTIYTLTIVSAEGCKASDDVKVTVLSNCIGKPMNAITPNGDGINDRWVVTSGNCDITVRVKVFNRYGGLVFESTDYHNNWMGKYKDKELPDGTYYYYIEYRQSNGQIDKLKGDLTILR